MRLSAVPPVLSLLLLLGHSAEAAERLDRAAYKVLAPHKAIYKIEMTAKRSSSQILNIQGEMYFAMHPSCEAWTTDHRFNLHYEYADSPPMQITSDFTTYEPLNGESFDFNSRRKRDGVMYQELRGAATRKDDGSINIQYSQPIDLHYTMDQKGLFPMGHTATMMQKIAKGEKIFNALVFDGSDEEGPVEINTIIGKPVNVLASFQPGPAIDTVLINSPARKIRMAFFPTGSSAPNADYEMDVILHDNGIISHMDVDYGEFSVSQKLVALEKIAPPVCGSEAAQSTPAEKAKDRDSDASKAPAEPAPKKKLFGIIP